MTRSSSSVAAKHRYLSWPASSENLSVLQTNTSAFGPNGIAGSMTPEPAAPDPAAGSEPEAPAPAADAVPAVPLPDPPAGAPDPASAAVPPVGAGMEGSMIGAPLAPACPGGAFGTLGLLT